MVASTISSGGTKIPLEKLYMTNWFKYADVMEPHLRTLGYAFICDPKTEKPESMTAKQEAEATKTLTATISEEVMNQIKLHEFNENTTLTLCETWELAKSLCSTQTGAQLEEIGERMDELAATPRRGGCQPSPRR